MGKRTGRLSIQGRKAEPTSGTRLLVESEQTRGLGHVPAQTRGLGHVPAQTRGLGHVPAQTRGPYPLDLLPQIEVCPEPAAPRPAPVVDLLAELWTSGRLTYFATTLRIARSAVDGFSSGQPCCHALMRDLWRAGAVDGFTCVEGKTDRWDEHAWLEKDGWVVDIANANVVVMDRDLYRATVNAEVDTARDWAALAASYAKAAPRLG